jgi:hypothetical protein
MLTIAYFTSRRDPRIAWFFDSLHRETGGNYDGVRVVVVDFWAQPMPGWGEMDVFHRRQLVTAAAGAREVWHVAPKPTVWQGPARRTKADWFAASNARNTALCLAPDGWIAFVDDLSVLMPGWLAAVRSAIAGPQNRIMCGAYRKVKDLVVEHGEVVRFTDHPPGVDNRWSLTGGQDVFPCDGNWMYGCSLVAPVEGFLQINGYPEALCDGMGFEDVIAGIMLAKRGFVFAYNRNMLTLESEELHAQLPVMKRSDYGVSPNDKSHAVLNAAQQGNGWHPNYFGEGGLRALRDRVLGGETFPECRVPEHEFFTSTRLEDL